MMLDQMEEVATSFNLARESDGEEGGIGGGARSVSCQTTLPRKQGLQRAGRGRGGARGAGRRGSSQGGGSGLSVSDQHPVDHWLKVKAYKQKPKLERLLLSKQHPPPIKYIPTNGSFQRLNHLPLFLSDNRWGHCNIA